MSAKRFIFFMLLLMAFTAGLFAYARPVSAKENQKNECPAGGGASCIEEDASTKAIDGLQWESVSRHLLNVIQ